MDKKQTDFILEEIRKIGVVLKNEQDKNKELTQQIKDLREQLAIQDVSQQRELFYNFITWYNAIPKMDKPKNGLITTGIIEKYIKL